MDVQLLGQRAIVGGPKNLVQNRVLLYLCAHFPQPTFRERIIADLWPDDDVASASNRFRVALSRLRRMVPLVEIADEIRLSDEGMRIDVYDMSMLIAEASDEPDRVVERELLERTIPKLALPLLPDITEDWVLPLQAQWSTIALGAIQRLIAIGRDCGDFALQAAASQCGLRHFPYDESLWHSWLEAMSVLGETAIARKAFVQARRSLIQDGGDFGQDLVALVDDLGVAGATHGKELLPPNEAHLMTQFFARCLHQHPALAVEILGSREFRPDVIRSPQTSLNLLQAIHLDDVPPSEAKERVRVRIITALSLLSRYQEVVEHAETFLSEPIDPSRRRIALLNVSFSYYQVGRSQDAFAAIEEAHRIAVETGYLYDAWQILGQRANLLTFNGEYDEAIEIFKRALEYFRNNELPDLDPDIHSLNVSLALALALKGDFDQAYGLILREHVSQDPRNPRVFDYLGDTILGWCQAVRGDRHASCIAWRRALRLAYRTGDHTAIRILCLSAESLDIMGEPAASQVKQDWIQASLAYGLPHYAMERERLERWNLSNAKRDMDGRDLVDRVSFAIGVFKRLGK